MSKLGVLVAMIRLNHELTAWIVRGRASYDRRQKTIDDIKRRCGVTTPEKS